MSYSYRIEQALRAAALLHEGEYRKGSAPYPYIVHPIGVSLILSDYTDDETVMVAGLLHDTLERSDYTKEELEQDFGEEVATLVLEVTEGGKRDQTDEPWQERRDRYIEQLQKASDNALLVAAADAIHNMRSIVEEYHSKPERFTKDFSGSLEERLREDQKLSNLFNRRIKNRIIHEFNHVFDEYKKFIEHANDANSSLKK